MGILCKDLPTPLHKSKLLLIYTRTLIISACFGMCFFIAGLIYLAIFYNTDIWSFYLPIAGISGGFCAILVLILNTYTSYNIIRTDWGTKHLNKIKKTWGLLSLFLVNPLCAYIFIKIAINELKKSDQEFKEIVFLGSI